MMKKGMRRLSAFALAVVLGVTSVTSYGSFTGDGMAVSQAADVDRVVFAQGAGTGTDFSADSWKLYGVEDVYGNGVTINEITDADKAPIIEPDTEYLMDNQPVIRLINGVKAASDGSGLEDTSSSYTTYRSGEAFLQNGIQLDSDAGFSVKFTFSMPEAVVNTTQTAGDTYAREVGGDGIAFVMTTDSTHNVQAGSGIGYYGIDNSIAVEMDSYFNGAYCVMSSGNDAYENWNFDNQLYFHSNGDDGDENYSNPDDPYSDDYINYQNYNFAERFDHVAITTGGNVKQHEIISYINGLDPTDCENGTYTNLAYNNTTSTNTESTEATCATRFADKNVDNRLFTVWIDYDGTNMHVSYANGNYESATKPSSPQITYPADLSSFKGETVYMGFTSAVGSSKANHTIHSFKFVNRYDAAYKVNYYLKNDQGTYVLDKSSEVYTGDIGDDVDVTDVNADYATEYTGYTLSTTKTQETTATLAEAGETYEMNVYYDPVVVEKAKYKLNYYKLNPNTGLYELADSTTTYEGDVGSTYSVTDVDASYESKYSSDSYSVNTTKNESYSVKLTEKDKTYEMNVYYDPAKATYKTEYYLKNSDTGEYELKDTVNGEETYVGKTVNADVKTYDGYVHVQTTDSNESDQVEANNSTTLKVYYDPEPGTPNYKLNYYKLNPNTGEYEYITSTGVITGTKGDTKTITDADADYADKYTSDGYVVNTDKDEDWEVTLEEDDGTYEMNVYYDPKKVTYKTVYYQKQEDGTYVAVETVEGEETYVGKTVTAEIKTYDGYTHVTTNDTLETTEVSADGSTTMKVYYDPKPKPTYTVQYYVEQQDGTYKLYTEKTNLTGDAGSTVTAEIITISGYTHTTTADSNETDTVREDGSTVLKVYYKLQPTTEATTAATTESTTEYYEEDTEEEYEEDEEEEEEDETTETKANKPKTGDATNMTFLIIVMLATGTTGVICLYFRKKEDE